jgi:hypothetical protein
MARPVIFVASRNPNTPGGGADTYIRAHARAAARAGFEPHIFCRGSPPGVEETDFGIVHQVVLPFWRRFLQTRAKRLYYSQFASFEQHTLNLDPPKLVDALETFVRANPRTTPDTRFWMLGVRRCCPRRTPSADRHQNRSYRQLLRQRGSSLRQ